MIDRWTKGLLLLHPLTINDKNMRTIQVHVSWMKVAHQPATTQQVTTLAANKITVHL